jgi:hypothetical protein
LSTPNEPKDANDSQPGELAKGLAPVRDATGLPPPQGEELRARVINVGLPKMPRPPQRLAVEIAELLQRENVLFKMGKELGQIDPNTGEWEAMDAHRFVTWIKNTADIMPICGYHKETGVPIEAGLGVDQARVVLRSDDMKVKMPVIDRIHHVKLPILRQEKDERGLPKLELLRPGYDATSRTFTTLGGPDFDEDMDFDAAVDLLWKRFGNFSWRDQERDFPIHLAAMLSMFCRGMLKSRVPLIVYNANIVESGKTLLAWFVSWVTHGTKETRPLIPESDERLIDTLDTIAKAKNPYLIFDNIDWGNKEIKNPILDEWITKSEHVFRLKGGNTEHKEKLECMTIMTGNQVKLSADLQGRALICDIWNPLSAEERPPLPVGTICFDDEYFEEQDHRGEYLAAFWALVKRWDKLGRPVMPGRAMSRFPAWSRVIPSIVWHAGQEAGGTNWNCLKPSGNVMVGDQSSREYKQLAQYAVAEFGLDPAGGFKEEFEVSVAQLAGIARRYQIATEKLYPEKTIEDVRSTENDKGGWKWKKVAETFELAADMDEDKAEEADKNRQASEWLSAKSKSSFGIVLTKKVHDLEFRGPDGYLYLFRHVPHSAPTVYRVKRVTTGPRAAQVV